MMMVLLEKRKDLNIFKESPHDLNKKILFLKRLLEPIIIIIE